jgi:centriolar protein POC1
LKIFDTQNGTLIHSFKDEKGFGNKLSWHKDNNTIAVAQDNGRVKIFDVAQRKLIQYYRIYDCSVNSLDFHPSGNYMVTGDEKGLVTILDLQEGRDIFTITGHSGAVTATKFSKDGNYFVTGSKDKHIMIFKSYLPNSYYNDNEEEVENQVNAKENCPILDPTESVKGGSTMIDTRKSVHYNFSAKETCA